jgi:RNA polymerase I-specific transcription initiation factor RRN6
MTLINIHGISIGFQGLVGDFPFCQTFSTAIDLGVAARKITPLGPPLTVLQPSIEQSSLEDIRTAVKRTEGIKKLAQSFPELVPGISCFPELAQESEIIRKTVSRHDPTASSLFAFGKAKDQSYGQTGSRPGAKEVPIIAVAGGSVGHAVRLIRLRKEEAGWERNKSVRLTNFLLKDQEQGWWFTNGSPIQQLCFAESSGKARARVAVRYPGAITVLEPLLQADAVPARSFYDPDVRRTQYPEARLDANPVLTLTTDYTGGSPHADISFNPWHTAQFAVVDQLGHWSIWELKPRTQLRDGKNVDAGPSGFISDECTDEPESFVKADDGDGWGMIMWAGDRSTIIVANRKTLSLFSIEDDNKRLHVPKLFEPKRIDWILDMKRSRLNLAHVFLLTSTRVFWLHIIPGGRLGEGGRESGATILLSWIHFRDQQDISLGLNVLDDEDSAFSSVAVILCGR